MIGVHTSTANLIVSLRYSQVSRVALTVSVMLASFQDRKTGSDLHFGRQRLLASAKKSLRPKMEGQLCKVRSDPISIFGIPNVSIAS